MPIGISITDSATPSLRKIALELHRDGVKEIVGRAGVNNVRAHLFNLDRERANALGGRRTHFYARAARSTNYRDELNGVVISVSHVGIAQRYFGGVIRPVKAKRLAIPARAEAHGRRPREFDNLEPAFGRKGVYALVERRATTLKRTSKGFAKGRQTGGGVMFWLVESVTQQPDPTVLPDERELADGIMPEVDSYLTRVLSGKR